MNNRTFMYTIPGSPQNVVRYKNLSHAIRDKYQDSRSFYRVSLGNQHDDQHEIDTPLKGPLAIDCVFVFDQSKTQQSSSHKINYHKQFPTLASLYAFIENIMKGLVFDNDVLIVRVSMLKIYGAEPRTDIVITKL